MNLKLWIFVNTLSMLNRQMYASIRTITKEWKARVCTLPALLEHLKRVSDDILYKKSSMEFQICVLLSENTCEKNL